MYTNAGKSIKTYVSTMVTIGYIIFGGVGTICLWTGIISNGVLEAFVGILVGAVGCFFVWLSGLMLYAYGELVDRMISIDKKMSSFVKEGDEEQIPDDRTECIFGIKK